MNSTCYWCGAAATSRDHVPPRNLFPKGKSINLITVPACKTHNQDMGAFDEKFRAFLQMRGTNADAEQEFSTTTFRGLSRPEGKRFVDKLAAGARPVSTSAGMTMAFQVDPNEQNLYFEKIIRGLYFHIFKKPAPGRVVSISRDFITPGFDYAQLYGQMAPYLNDPSLAKELPVSNPDIFRCKYVRQERDGQEFLLFALLFYRGVEVIGMIWPGPTPGP